jgi:hypothetical protein
MAYFHQIYSILVYWKRDITKAEYLKAFAKLDLNFSGKGDIISKGFEWIDRGIKGQ